ncbi:NADPH-dependent F420 reductase [Parachryseolinea silvisoli]|uniref:NADPH-dependent F420 reductase n=1 Tax=Parachryseolinea silvisoli TaxID=2873601 RepID=UPI002265A0C6|nr:NAD(P)-binding domain-containing protein [Parachryseolinea silvisoli]MCD9017682.1 NAD(P)-binding domain-containing protein [Parachryseolinea silvisoli]
MVIGTIGAGRIAKAFVGHVAKAGYQVIMSNKSGADSLREIAAGFGTNVSTGTVEEAAKADVVLLSIPWEEIPRVLGPLRFTDNQIILDTNNAIQFPEFKPMDLGGQVSTKIVQSYANHAKVVKVFNTLEASTLAQNPKEAGGNRVVFLSGDEPASKEKVKALLKTLGFAPVDLGDLDTGGKIQTFGGPLSGLNLIRL